MIRLLYGNNTFASLKRLQELILLQSHSVVSIDGEFITSIDEIFSHTDSISMFAEKKLILVKRLQNNRRKISLERLIVERLEKQIEQFEYDIIFWEDSTIRKTASRKTLKTVAKNAKKKDSGQSLLDFIKTHGEAENFTQLQEFQIITWLQQKLATAGITNAVQFTTQIIAKCGLNQAILDTEVDKLLIKLHVENRHELQASDLEILTRYDAVSMVWELTDAIGSKNKALALSIIDKLLVKSTDTQFVFAVILKQLKSLYLIKAFPSQSQRIKKLLGMKDYTYNKTLRFASRFSIEHIKKLFSKLVDLDFAIKQGKIDSKLGLDLLITTLN